MTSSRFPDWFRRQFPQSKTSVSTASLEKKFGLSTICSEALCPNRRHCSAQKKATFLALGNHCTRGCGFCSVAYSSNPPLPDPEEPKKIAQCAQALGLRHIVITMVSRDDLPDQGASAFCAVLREVQKVNPSSTIEVLVSDFSGEEKWLHQVLSLRPQIFAHNVETVRSLTSKVRAKASYERSLHVLRLAKISSLPLYIKSGFMVGLGERELEVQETIHDLHNAGCEIITIGQYLQPTPRQIPIESFIRPEQFESYAAYGRSLGVPYMICGPFVRSSLPDFPVERRRT